MIDYGDLIKRSYQILIRYKFLWLFGFIVAFTSGGYGNYSNFSSSEKSGNEFQRNFKIFEKFSSINIALILFLIGIAIIIGIVFLILRYISTAALISSVDDIEKQRDASVKKGFTNGWHHWLYILGIDLVIFIPLTLIIIIILTILVGPGILLIILKKMIAGIVLLVIGALIAIVLIIALAIFSGLLELLSIRYKIIKNESVFASISLAFKLITAKIGQVIITWLITVAIGIITGIILAIPGLIFAAIFFGLALISFALAILVAFPFVILFSFASGIIQTYISTLWTLAFLSLDEGLEKELEINQQPAVE